MTPEKYIKAYTRGNSNELVGGGYHEWLTPENALAAVELAREEMKKPASEDLEQASEEYAYTNWESDDYHEGASEGKPFDAIGYTQKCFIDGAQWQKEQMMKKALTYLHNKLHFDNVFYGIVSTDFNSMEEMYEDFKNYMKGE